MKRVVIFGMCVLLATSAVSGAQFSGSADRRSGVRQAARLASCAEISDAMFRAEDRAFRPDEIDCGAGRVVAQAALETTRMRWNRALASWEIFARCVRPADCLPFLVRVHGREALGELAPKSAQLSQGSAGGAEAVMAVVRPGQKAMLTWDEAGISVVVPVVCLDSGALGGKVRVRLGGNRTMRAVVVSAGQLRADS